MNTTRTFPPQLAALLSCLAIGCAGDAATSELSPRQAPVAGVDGISAQLDITSQWTQGYCARVLVFNDHPDASTGTWDVEIDLGESTVDNFWSSSFSGTSGIVHATPGAPWAAVIGPGQRHEFGFCASRDSADALPRVGAVTSDLPPVEGGSETDAGETGGGELCDVAPPTSTVELRVDAIDDWVYVTVNGIRRKVYHYGDPDAGALLDVTGWFSAGVNEVRVHGIDGPVTGDFDLELFVDGTRVVEAGCDTADCGADYEGIFLDETFEVTVPGAPAAQVVDLVADVPGAIYIDDVYTGLEAPTSLTLPPGEYTLGLGVGGIGSGSYYEETIEVDGCPQLVDLTAGGPLAVQNVTRVALLPIRNTVHGDPAEVGVLEDSDIPPMLAQMEATRAEYVEPDSFGLTTWEIEALPIVEETTLYRGAASGEAPQTDEFLTDAGLRHLLDDYDIIVFYYGTERADGTPVAHLPCCYWAGGPQISFSEIEPADPNAPNVYLYH